MLLGCVTTDMAPAPSPNGGYRLEVENLFPDDVVVYLLRGSSKQRLGRIPGIVGKRVYTLDRMTVENGGTALLICQGNYTPTNRNCYATGPMRGSYRPRYGQPGVVMLQVQSHRDIVAILNGE